METDDPVAAVGAIVKPWLWGDWRYPLPPLARVAPHPPFSFDGWVRHDLGPATADTPAREVRAWQLKGAEDALDALAAAGWQLTDYPVMEFSGSLDFACVTLADGLVQPAQQHSIGLRIRFGITGPHMPAIGPVVIRRRSPEEVRARLLGPSSPLPRELAEAFLDEMAPEGS